MTITFIIVIIIIISSSSATMLTDERLHSGFSALIYISNPFRVTRRTIEAFDPQLLALNGPVKTACVICYSAARSSWQEAFLSSMLAAAGMLNQTCAS